MVLGIRGIPNVQGGVETHAQHLYERLSQLGCDVEIVVRTPFVARQVRKVGAVRLRRVWSPRRPGLEAMVHSLLGVLVAGAIRPDILHIHAVGPAIVAPLARLLGLRVVFTHHGPDYDRDKWGGFAKWVLRTGERHGVYFSHARIAISKVIVALIGSKYRLGADLIPNGVIPAKLRADTEHVQSFNLQPGNYFLQVSRLVPEKRQLDLIDAFAALRRPGWKLALVGGMDDSAYCQELQKRAQAAGVVLTGFQSGIALEQLYSNAGVFVLPSSHEGLPIAMLEAMSFGLPVIASNIPANLEVGLPAANYFPLGNIAELSQRLEQFSTDPISDRVRADMRLHVAQRYNWQSIAEQTLAVYQRVLKRADTTPLP